MKTTTLTLATVASLISGSFFAQDLQLNLNTFNPICHNDATGKAELFISGGSLPYFVNGIELEGDVYTLNELEAGQYNLIVSDANNESSTLSFAILNPEPINVHALVSHVTTYNGDDGKIQVWVGQPATYLWTSPTVEISNETAEDQGNLRAGMYTLKVIDNATGCRTTRHYEIHQPTMPSFNSNYNPSLNSIAQAESATTAMHVFPNPSSGTVNLKAEKELTGAYVMNDFGIIVHRCDKSVAGSIETIQLSPGTYTLISTDKTGTQFAERIMIR